MIEHVHKQNARFGWVFLIFEDLLDTIWVFGEGGGRREEPVITNLSLLDIFWLHSEGGPELWAKETFSDVNGGGSEPVIDSAVLLDEVLVFFDLVGCPVEGARILEEGGIVILFMSINPLLEELYLCIVTLE